MSLPSPVEVINDFTFPDNGRIFEVKFTDIVGTDKTHKYKWYLILDNTRRDLKFINMKNNVRYFTFGENLKITLDVPKHELIYEQVSGTKKPWETYVETLVRYTWTITPNL